MPLLQPRNHQKSHLTPSRASLGRAPRCRLSTLPVPQGKYDADSEEEWETESDADSVFSGVGEDETRIISTATTPDAKPSSRSTTPLFKGQQTGRSSLSPNDGSVVTDSNLGLSFDRALPIILRP